MGQGLARRSLSGNPTKDGGGTKDGDGTSKDGDGTTVAFSRVAPPLAKPTATPSAVAVAVAQLVLVPGGTLEFPR